MVGGHGPDRARAAAPKSKEREGAAFELGLMGVEIPERWGGAGLDSVSYALVMTEISAAIRERMAAA